MPVWKWFVKVSGKRRTGRPPLRRVRRANHDRNVSRENLGRRLSRAIPPAAFASAARPGVCVTKFAREGAPDASLAQEPTRPIEYAAAGRSRPR